MIGASPERAARWPGKDIEAITYLESRGFIQTENWNWIRTDDRTELTEKEEDAILYLLEEWDWGVFVLPGGLD